MSRVVHHPSGHGGYEIAHSERAAAVRVRMKIELREDGAGSLPHAAAVDESDRTEAAQRRIAEPNILGNRQRRDQAQLLRDGYNARRNRVVRTGKIARPPGNENAPAVGTAHATQNADQGGLAGAILADDGVNFAGVDFEVDMVERNIGFESLADILRVDRRDGSLRSGPDAYFHLSRSRIARPITHSLSFSERNFSSWVKWVMRCR